MKAEYGYDNIVSCRSVLFLQAVELKLIESKANFGCLFFYTEKVKQIFFLNSEAKPSMFWSLLCFRRS